MTLLRRLALLGSMLICLSVTFAAAAIATDAQIAGNLSVQGKGGPPPGGGLLPAGNYHNTNVFASYFLCCGFPQLTVNVSVNTNVANPLVGPSTSTKEVDVNFQACDSSGVCGAGCFIPDGANDFTFNSSLTAAALNTTVTNATAACQGNPITNLARPFTVNVTWTATGVSLSSSGVGRYACGSYRSETQTTTGGNTSTSATASTSLFPGTFPITNAGLNLFDQRIHAEGTPLDSCSPLGGKGAGFGPLGAGNYHFVSQQASLSFQPDPTQQPFNVFVTTFTNTSSPRGGPTTTQAETDLNISQFTFPFPIQGCFIIPASAFTIASGLQGASVTASIDPTTPPCPQSNNSGLPPSFTVHVTWTATSPLETLNTTGSFDCGSFHSVASGSLSSINASASGGVSGIADSFSTTQAFIGTNESTTHIQGQQNCF
jgi:hypothetical protein